jgi:hypothetical protein
MINRRTNYSISYTSKMCATLLKKSLYHLIREMNTENAPPAPPQGRKAASASLPPKYMMRHYGAWFNKDRIFDV